MKRIIFLAVIAAAIIILLGFQFFVILESISVLLGNFGIDLGSGFFAGMVAILVLIALLYVLRKIKS